jgi:hypothetical protein
MSQISIDNYELAISQIIDFYNFYKLSKNYEVYKEVHHIVTNTSFSPIFQVFTQTWASSVTG